MTAGPPGMAAAGGLRAGTSWPVILAGRRGLLLIGMTLTELVVAVQILIVVTVLPAVVRQLGGIRLYGLALSVAAIAGIGLRRSRCGCLTAGAPGLWSRPGRWSSPAARSARGSPTG